MDAKVYITLPKGYSPEEDELPYKPVHLLLKGLPGAPQSSRLFYNLMHTVLTNAGYERLQPDHCLYIIKGKALLLLWVDDFVNTVAHQAIHIELLKRLEQARLTVKNLGEVRTFLGARFQRDISGKKLTIDQEEPIRRLGERAGLADAKPASTPCAPGTKFTKNDCPREEEMEDMADIAKPFRSQLAGCVYISYMSRPDICFTVSNLCAFMANPGKTHLAALRHLLRYLKGTAF